MVEMARFNMVEMASLNMVVDMVVDSHVHT